MKRLLWLLGPVPFLALAVLTMGLAAGVAAAVFDALQPSIAVAASWLRYPLTGLLLSPVIAGAAIPVLAWARAVASPIPKQRNPDSSVTGRRLSNSSSLPANCHVRANIFSFDNSKKRSSV